MTILAPYNKLDLATTIDKLRECRTAQLKLIEQIKLKPGIQQLQRGAIVATMSSHCDALGSALEMLDQIESSLPILRTVVEDAAEPQRAEIKTWIDAIDAVIA